MAAPQQVLLGLGASGGGGPFSPSDLAGLKIWLKADAIVGLSDGDPVTTWSDSSGNGYDATQSSSGLKPLYKTSVVNGKPVVRFDGADDFLVTGGQSYAIQTIFVVYETSSIAYRGVFATRASSVIGGIGNSDGNYGFAVSNSGGGITSTDAGATDSGAHSGVWVDGVVGSHSDFDTYLVTAGVPVSAGNWHVVGCTRTSQSASGAKFFAIGDDPGVSSRELAGDLAEIIVYDSALSTGNRQSVEDYLGTKYGITITH